MLEHHDVTVRVRYAETDQMGVVYHSNYLIWFEVGRVELMRSIGFDYKSMEKDDDTYMVVADAHCRYHYPARYDELLTIRTRILEAKTRVLKFGYEILRQEDRKLLATGDTTHVTTQPRGPREALPRKIQKRISRACRCVTRPEHGMSIVLTGNELTFSLLHAVALHNETVSLSPEAIARMTASRAVVDHLVASGKTAYGINTGFGKLASVRISSEQVRQLQINLVRSHACGVGAPLSEAETRAMMLLRANALAKGHSGVRPRVVETLMRYAQRRCSSGDSFAGVRRRFWGSRAARASCASGDRRRRGRLHGK